MVFLEYEYKNTVIHNSSSLVKTVIPLAISVLSIFWQDPRFIIPLMVMTYFIGWLAKVPTSWYKIMAVGSVMTLPLSLWTSTYTASPELFKVYPEEFIGITLYEFWLPFLGRGVISYGSLLWISASYLKIFAVMPIWFVFVYTVRPDEFCEMLISIRMPMKLVFLVKAILRFVPVMSRKLTTIINAQKLRGLTVGGRNPVVVIKKYSPILIPLSNYLLQSVDEVDKSVSVRGYGLRTPTIVSEQKIKTFDYIVIILSLIVIALAAYGLMEYNYGML
jgi:energy-coupling factor transporter transmembrane protein EcfT